MIKKSSIFVLAALFLAACGTGNEDTAEPSEDTVIQVASHLPPMTDIVEVAAEVIEDGYTIELVTVSDNVQYNEILNNQEVDANFAQHVPYMEQYNEEMDGNLVGIQPIYNALVGFYSREYDSIDEIPEGATVALPNDVSNEGRALAMLDDQGLITLEEGTGFEGTVNDIVENPLNLEWLHVDLLNLSEAYNESDVALVYNYPTYISSIGLTPEDALFLEETIDERFAITLVAREDNQDSEAIQALVRAMTSDEVREFLEEEHSDTLVPAF